MLISSTVLDDLASELEREIQRTQQLPGNQTWLGLARAKAMVESKRHREIDKTFEKMYLELGMNR